jgi:regulator of RNase E activity RraA
MPAGFRVLKRKRMVDPAWVERFRRIPVANVSDSMFRMSAGGARLRPYHKSGAMAGPAVTVRTAPGDNLMVHMALNLAEKGDVIVVDAGGELTNAIIGDACSPTARRKASPAS